MFIASAPGLPVIRKFSGTCILRQMWNVLQREYLKCTQGIEIWSLLPSMTSIQMHY